MYLSFCDNGRILNELPRKEVQLYRNTSKLHVWVIDGIARPSAANGGGEANDSMTRKEV